MKRMVEEKAVSEKKVVRKKAPVNKVEEKKVVEDKIVENKVVEKKTKSKAPNKDYFALLCGDVVLLVLVSILNEPDVNTVGVALMCAQLFGYLFNVYLGNREKLSYLFLSFMPAFISLYLIVALLVR
jgi:hypothetical protein